MFKLFHLPLLLIILLCHAGLFSERYHEPIFRRTGILAAEVSLSNDSAEILVGLCNLL